MCRIRGFFLNFYGKETAQEGNSPFPAKPVGWSEQASASLQIGRFKHNVS
jgi:hypothetical protein